MQEIADFLKNKREEAGMTQQHLADLTGLNHDSKINRIESGKRKVSWDDLGKISKALGNFHVFEALLVAGYISEEDINPVCKLHHLDKLSENDIDSVQQYIDFLLYRRTLEKKEV